MLIAFMYRIHETHLPCDICVNKPRSVHMCQQAPFRSYVSTSPVPFICVNKPRSVHMGQQAPYRSYVSTRPVPFSVVHFVVSLGCYSNVVLNGSSSEMFCTVGEVGQSETVT